MRIVIIGNCQAKALEMVWSVLRPQDDVVSYEVHTVIDKPLEEVAARRRISMADIVIHQNISDDYPVQFARTSVLKELHDVKRVCIPNMYFTGLQPDIIYVGSSQDRITTSMGHYHSNIVLRSFLAGCSIREARANLNSKAVYEKLAYFEQYDISLKELKRRDMACDVYAAPLLENVVLSHPTLFTVNHPMNILIKAIVTECFRLLSIQFTDVDLHYLPNTLAGGPVWPPSTLIRDHLGLGYAVGSYLKTDWKGQRVLSYDQFVTECYAIYKNSLSALLKTQKVIDILGESQQDLRDIDQYSLVEGNEDSFSEAISVGRSSVSEMLTAGARFAANDRSAALALANQALWLAGSNVVGLVDVARFFGTLGDHNKYGSLLLETLSTPPADLVVRRELLRYYLSLNDVGEARKFLRDTVEAGKGEITTLRFVANGFRQLKDHADALSTLIPTLQDPRCGEADYAAIAHLLMDLRQPGLAISAIDLAIRYSPNDAHHYALRGYAFSRLGLLEPAERDYQKSVELEPTNVEFGNLLSNVLQKRKEILKASDPVLH